MVITALALFDITGSRQRSPARRCPTAPVRRVRSQAPVASGSARRRPGDAPDPGRRARASRAPPPRTRSTGPTSSTRRCASACSRSPPSSATQGPTRPAGPCAPAAPARSACCSPSGSPTRSATRPPSPPCAASPIEAEQRRDLARRCSPRRSSGGRRRPPRPCDPRARRRLLRLRAAGGPPERRAPRSSGSIPVVVADTPHIPGVPFVSIDDRGGARAAAQHLLDLGHRRLGGRLAAHPRRRPHGPRRRRAPPRRRPTASRASASRATRRRSTAAGLDWDDVPIYEGHPNSRALGARGGRARCSRSTRPRPPLLAMSDEIALGVDRRRARRRPRRARASSRSSASTTRPPRPRAALTTVRQPLVEKGRTAGRMLLEAIEGGTPADVALPTELVVRGSTAPLRP